MEDFKTELKAKLDNKIDKEYEDLLADLRNSTPQVIIESESMSSFWTQNRVIFTLTFFLFHRVFDNLLQNVSFFYYTIPL